VIDTNKRERTETVTVQLPMIYRYPILPMGKPRMTRSDRWRRRPCVLRYRAFKEEVRIRRVTVPAHDASITFVLPMPKSWPQAKRDALDGQPHQQKPDVDNLLKALLDAVYDDDAHVASCSASKVWGEKGAIVIEHMDRAA